MHMKYQPIIFFSVLCIISSPGFSQVGIASKYPGDKGIKNDPAVIFAENFEGATLPTIVKRWTAKQNVAGMSLVLDTPMQSSSDKHSLQITSIGGENTGGYLFKRLPQGYDKLYFRYYIKYAKQSRYHHSGGKIGGYYPPTNWPQGGAGERPRGDDSFSIAIEPMSTSRRLDFYIYWMHMRTNPDKRYWGNDFIQESDLIIPAEQWICVEVMVKMNSPVDAYNGELALWINGEKIIHLKQGAPKGRWVWDSFHPHFAGTPFEGFQWRNDANLNINWIWLAHYVTKNPPGLVGKVWFDDVVLATEYIGPITDNGTLK